MWDIKDIMLFICSVLVVILISVKTAGANPITDWFETEKQKTIEFQKKGWQDGKDELVRTKESILKLFKKKNDTQD